VTYKHLLVFEKETHKSIENVTVKIIASKSCECYIFGTNDHNQTNLAVECYPVFQCVGFVGYVLWDMNLKVKVKLSLCFN
jgi:hypothetical protein